MAILKDYITGLFSSITDARASSDYVSAQIAQQYKNHEILKSFAIPRMRVDTVEMDIPVALSKLDIKRSLRSSFDVGAITLSTYEAACRSFTISPSDVEIKIATEIKQKVYESVYNYVENLAKEGKLDEEKMHSVASTISDIVYNSLSEVYSLKEMSISSQNAIDSVRTTLYNSVVDTIYDNVSVLATAEELSSTKEFTISKIKLTVREDGMEWAFSKDENGRVQSSLIHE